MRRSTVSSWSPGGFSAALPSTSRTRQVEQRARPPHTAAWGMRASRAASSTDDPAGTCTRWRGPKDTTTDDRRPSRHSRNHRASTSSTVNTATHMMVP